MSGSAIADAAGPGLVTIKQMLKKPEYSPGFAGAVVVASATHRPDHPAVDPDGHLRRWCRARRSARCSSAAWCRAC